MSRLFIRQHCCEAHTMLSFSLRPNCSRFVVLSCIFSPPDAYISLQVFDRLLLLRKGGQTVYFGDIGHNATKLIHYFEHNGSRPCGPIENPCVSIYSQIIPRLILNLEKISAEFMLDVIGAGATASSEQDW